MRYITVYSLRLAIYNVNSWMQRWLSLLLSPTPSLSPSYPLALNTTTLPFFCNTLPLSAICLTDGLSGSQRLRVSAGRLLQTPGGSQCQRLPSGAPKSEGAPDSCWRRCVWEVRRNRGRVLWIPIKWAKTVSLKTYDFLALAFLIAFFSPHMFIYVTIQYGYG